MAFKAGAIVGTANLNTKGWDRGVSRVKSTAKTVAGAVKRMAQVGFVAATGAMVAAVHQANKYQKAFSNVSTLTDQNTKALQDMSLGLLSLDSNLGSTLDLTKSMYDAISAGAKPGKEAFDVITSSAKFAKAAMADNAASVKLLSATVNAYGKDAKTMAGAQLTAEAAADIFFTTIKDGVVTGEELSSTIGQSIPLFASMKIPVEQLAAGMAAMTKQGVSASEATTQLNAIVNAFLKPSEALNAVLAEQGFQSGQAFIQAEGLAGALELLQGATESGDYEIAQLTSNIRAMKGVLALSGEGAKIFNRTMGDMKKASGAVSVAFDKQEKTFETLKNTFSKSLIILGNVGKFFLDKIAKPVQEAVDALNNFVVSGQALDALLPIVSKIGGAFSVAATFVRSIYDLFKDDLMDAVAELRESFGKLGSGVLTQGVVFDALASSVDALGAAFSVSISLIKLLVENQINLANVALNLTKTFGDMWDVLTGKKEWSEVEKSFAGVKQALVELGNATIKNTKDVIETTKKQWAELTDDTRTSASTFADAFEKGFNETNRLTKKFYNTMISGVEDTGDEIEKKLKGIDFSIGTEPDDLVIDPKKIKFIGEQIDEIEDDLIDNESAWDRWGKTVAEKVAFWLGVAFENMQIVFDGISETTSMHYQNEQDKIELDNQQKNETRTLQYETEQAALDTQYQNSLLTEAQYNEQSQALKRVYENDINDIEKDSNKKKNDLMEKQFKANKKFAIANIWLGVAQSILGFWQWGAPLGPPGWITAGIMSATVAGIGIAQSIEAKKQQFVPQYAKGTDYHMGGAAIVGEKGPEMLNLPRGTKVRTASETKDILSGEYSGSKGITLNIHNPIVREESDIKKIANAVSNVLGKQLRMA